MNKEIVRFGDEKAAEYINKAKQILGANERYYFIETYGCQMNVRDSQTLAGILDAMGYQPIDTKEKADIILFNTCCVRENAELRVYGNLGALRALKESKPGLLIGVCGCMMQQSEIAESIKKRFKFVDLVFGTHNTHCLPELIYRVITEKKPVYSLWEKEQAIMEEVPVVRDKAASAWINITYGCDNFCSYCIVPYVRGRERSRKSEDIINEAKKLADEGFIEITLLGQNVNSYGKDANEMSFPQLLRELNKIKKLKRIRFMTSHPKDLSDELIDVFAECEKVCKYLHLPVQSGSNSILKLMNRGYTAEHYIALIKRLKDKVPELALSTDIIVGFPNETEEDFLETLKLYKEVCFNTAYTFMYSKRTGTPAAKMLEQVPQTVKKERLARLMQVQDECALINNQKCLDKTLFVLVEFASKRNEKTISGHSDCGRTVTFKGETELIGKIVPVKITAIKSKSLSGELIEEDVQCP